MTDPKSANNDPSMDDILASIRRIISDDEARAQVNSQQGNRPAATPPAGLSAGPRPEPHLQTSARDDVLLLTDLIEDPKTDGEAPTPPIPLPRIDPVRAAEMAQPSVEPTARPAAPSATGSALFGGDAASSATAAFARLNQAVQDSVPPPAAHDPGPVVGNNGKTVEDLVKEMLRPMLKEWLDRNLPQMVERYVEREIVRLTRR
jgi:cell pole-organizing protein PopZ